MKSVIRKIPRRVPREILWILLVVFLVAAGCAAPGSQTRAPGDGGTASSVVSVTGEELADRVRLSVEGNSTLAYTVFRLSEPLRLIVDLADTDVTKLESEISIDLGNIEAVSTIQFDEDAGKIGRLEVGLYELWEYETSRSENTIIIDFLKPVSVVEEEMPASVDEPGVPEVEAAAEIVEVVELTVPAEGSEEGTEGATEPEGIIEAAASEPGPPATFINSVLFEEDADSLRVEFVGDGSVTNFETLNLSGPARLVVDIRGVAKGFAPTRIPVEMGGVTRIRIGEHYDDDKLRFVMDVDSEEVPPYAVESSGNSLVVTFGDAAEGVEAAAPAAAEIVAEPAPEPVQVEEPVSAEVEAAAETAPEPAPETKPEIVQAEIAPVPLAEAGSLITDVRYRSEESGGAVLIISDDVLEFNIDQPDERHLLVDLNNVSLAKTHVRSQDTRDQPGALLALSSFNPKGSDGARVALTFDAGTTFEVDQTGGTITVSLIAPTVEVEEPVEVVQVVLPAAEEVAPAQTMIEEEAVEAEEPQGVTGPRRKYTGERITMDFQNADLLNVLRLIAEVSGFNMITSDAVGGRITMRMVDVPWDQALEIILKTKGLGQVREGNVVRIAPLSVLESERSAELKAREAQLKVEELILEIIPISYSKASDLVAQLSPFLSSRGSINTDSRTNSLIVKDIQANVEKVKGLVVELDVPTPQVRIEARIVIVDEGYIQNLGIQWGGNYDDGSVAVFGESGNTNFSGGLVNLPASNANTVLGVTFGNVSNFTNLDLRLSALEQNNKGRIISSPSLLVIQNETANIEVNNPFPENRTSTEVSDEGATTTTEVSFPDIWTRLKITPQVTSNEDIFMEVFVEKDSKGQQAIFDLNTFTGVNSHKLETKIILKNHGTAVIGGVYTENKKGSSSRVPFLHKIPLIGGLFKNKSSENTREELLIFINATIVED